MPPHLEGPAKRLAAARGSRFQNLHRNKRSMTLNLKSPKASLCSSAWSRRPTFWSRISAGREAALGIDYKTLSRINPKLIYASISGFGQTGPTRRGQALTRSRRDGGLMSITGSRPGPVRSDPIADLTAGLMCALGILVALLERDVKERQRSQLRCCSADFHARFQPRAGS